MCRTSCKRRGKATRLDALSLSFWPDKMLDPNSSYPVPPSPPLSLSLSLCPPFACAVCACERNFKKYCCLLLGVRVFNEIICDSRCSFAVIEGSLTDSPLSRSVTPFRCHSRSLLSAPPADYKCCAQRAGREYCVMIVPRPVRACRVSSSSPARLMLIAGSSPARCGGLHSKWWSPCATCSCQLGGRQAGRQAGAGAW